MSAWDPICLGHSADFRGKTPTNAVDLTPYTFGSPSLSTAHPQLIPPIVPPTPGGAGGGGGGTGDCKTDYKIRDLNVRKIFLPCDDDAHLVMWWNGDVNDNTNKGKLFMWTDSSGQPIYSQLKPGNLQLDYSNDNSHIELDAQQGGDAKGTFENPSGHTKVAISSGSTSVKASAQNSSVEMNGGVQNDDPYLWVLGQTNSVKVDGKDPSVIAQSATASVTINGTTPIVDVEGTGGYGKLNAGSLDINANSGSYPGRSLVDGNAVFTGLVALPVTQDGQTAPPGSGPAIWIEDSGAGGTGFARFFGASNYVQARDGQLAAHDLWISTDAIGSLPAPAGSNGSFHVKISTDSHNQFYIQGNDYIDQTDFVTLYSKWK